MANLVSDNEKPLGNPSDLGGCGTAPHRRRCLESRPRIPLYTRPIGVRSDDLDERSAADLPGSADTRLRRQPLLPWPSPGPWARRRCPRRQIRTRSITTCSRPVHSPSEEHSPVPEASRSTTQGGWAPWGSNPQPADQKDTGSRPLWPLPATMPSPRPPPAPQTTVDVISCHEPCHAASDRRGSSVDDCPRPARYQDHNRRAARAIARGEEEKGKHREGSCKGINQSEARSRPMQAVAERARFPRAN